MSPACEIVVQDRIGLGEAATTRLREWLVDVVGDLAPTADTFAVRLAGDREVEALNADLRGKSAPTDVLSFPGEPTLEGSHLGDVLISLDTAKRQAQVAGHSLERELEELLLHGILHCLGHDHETDDGEMERLEIELRERWVHHD